MTDIICIGPNHANLSLSQVLLFYITQWETKRNSIVFSNGVSSQGCVVLSILQPFALTLGSISEVYIKRKYVLPMVFKENEAGTHRPCAILSSYLWTELHFKITVKSQLIFLAALEQFVRTVFLIAARKHKNVDPMFFPLCAHLAPFIFTSETSICSHLYYTCETWMYRSPVLCDFPWCTPAEIQAFLLETRTELLTI